MNRDMIMGIGIDSIEVDRFSTWSQYSHQTLEKTFTRDEITYCLENPIKSAERFAVRFAAKEAFYKAFCSAFPQKVHLIRSKSGFNLIEIIRPAIGAPVLAIDWENLLIEPETLDHVSTHLSLTHTKTIATAIVLLQI